MTASSSRLGVRSPLLVDLNVCHDPVVIGKIGAGQAIRPIERSNGGLIMGPVFDKRWVGCIDCYRKRREAVDRVIPNTVYEASDIALQTAHKLVLQNKDETLAQHEHSVLRITSNGEVWPEVFLPMPFCECRKHISRETHMPRSGFRAVGRSAGIICDVAVANPATNLSVAATRVAVASDALIPTLVGMAADADPGTAVRRAVHESLERYCAFSPPPDFMPKTPVTRLRDSNTQLVSAASVWLGPTVGRKLPGASGTSDGLAVADCAEVATDRALLETFERLAFYHAWNARPPLMRLRSSALDSDANVALLPSWPGVRIALAWFYSDTQPFLALGLGAGQEAIAASQHAIDEAKLVRTVFSSDAASEVRDPLKVHGCLHDVVFARAALDAGFARDVYSWLALAEELGCTALDMNAEEAMQSAIDYFPDAWWVDITTPDVEDCGLHCIRVGLNCMHSADSLPS